MLRCWKKGETAIHGLKLEIIKRRSVSVAKKREGKKGDEEPEIKKKRRTYIYN